MFPRVLKVVCKTRAELPAITARLFLLMPFPIPTAKTEAPYDLQALWAAGSFRASVAFPSVNTMHTFATFRFLLAFLLKVLRAAVMAAAV